MKFKVGDRVVYEYEKGRPHTVQLVSPGLMRNCWMIKVIKSHNGDFRDDTSTTQFPEAYMIHEDVYNSPLYKALNEL